MKKINSIIVIILICAISIGCSGREYDTSESMANGWSGSIRIEGRNNTIWNGIVTVSETYFCAINVDTGLSEEHYISTPTALGALIEASKLGEFNLSIEYYPGWNGFYVMSVESDSNNWLYWVDYEQNWDIDAYHFNLTEDHNEVLWGYLVLTPPNYESHVLKINVDKSEVKKDETITVNVFDETNTSVCGATVYVNSEIYTTDNEGKARITLSNKGKHYIYSEMDGFVRSDKVSVQVKKKSLINTLETLSLNNLFGQILKIIKNIKLYNILNNYKLWLWGISWKNLY